MISHKWSPMKRLIWLRGSGITGGSAVWNTISGNPVSFSAKAAPLRQLSVAFSPVQSLNGYDSPWPAGGGANKLPVVAGTVTQDGLTYVATADGKIKVTGTADVQNSIVIQLPNTVTIANGDYLHFRNVATSSGSIYLKFSDDTARQPGFTSANRIFDLSASAGKTLVAIGISYDLGAELNVEYQPSIENTSSVTTYSPYSNLCPISGWSSVTVEQRGKNLLPNLKYQQSVTQVTIGQNVGRENYPIFLKAGKYTISVSCEPSCNIYASPKGESVINLGSNAESRTFTVASDGYYEFFCYRTVSLDIDEITSFQLELGETATDYTPYNPLSRSISISLGQTVYSGTLDVVTGVGEITGVAELQTVGAVKLRTIPYNATYPNTAYYRINTSYAYKSDTVVLGNIGMLYGNAAQAAQSGGIGYALSTGTGTGQYLHTMIPMEEGDTAQTIDTRYFGYNPVIYYELLDPIPIQLTPQEVQSLLGENVMFSDANGDVTVTYRSN